MIFLKFLVLSFSPFLVFGILSLPYFISNAIYLSSPTYSHFFKFFYLYTDYTRFTYNVIDDLILFSTRTIGVSIILILIAIFIPNIKNALYNREKSNLVGYMKSSFIFCLFLYIFFNSIYYVDFFDTRGIVNFFKVFKESISIY